jgi:hypothetical protein
MSFCLAIEVVGSQLGVGSTSMLRFLCSIVLMPAITLNCGTALAQAPPTATEAFSQWIRCNNMADKKAEKIYLGPAQQVIFSIWTSRYDPKSNRCYIRLDSHTRNAAFDIETHQVYDGQKDDLLASANIKNGKKSGTVFDDSHRSTTDENHGWNDALDYMEVMMTDKRY